MSNALPAVVSVTAGARRNHPSSTLALLAAVAFVAAFTACSTSGLSFVQDESLSITSPADGATVPLPLTVRWTVEPGREAARYAVFVDRAPVHSGDDVREVVDADLCLGVPGCPDEKLLRSFGVYLTTATSIDVTAVVDRPDGRGAHEIRIVRLDAGGRRVSEDSHGVRFFVEDDAPTGTGARGTR